MSSGVTAVVCTYNRAESLRDTLQSLADQLPHGTHPLEILVVDNNSTDATKAVVEEAARQSPWNVRYVFEPRQGVAFARNRGFDEAQSEYIAFTDDDVIVTQDWTRQLVQVFEETGADLVGGKIVAHWIADKPEWLSADLMGSIIAQDYGPERKQCSKECFLTANLAVRSSAIERFGKFRTNVGRVGNSLLGGEDFEFCERWLKNGALTYYEPAAVVKHKVEPSRLTKVFFRRWYRDIALTQAYMEDWSARYRWAVMPLWRWMKLIKAFGQYLLTRPQRGFREEVWWIYHRSYFRERLSQWRKHCIATNKPTKYERVFEGSK